MLLSRAAGQPALRATLALPVPAGALQSRQFLHHIAGLFSSAPSLSAPPQGDLAAPASPQLAHSPCAQSAPRPFPEAPTDAAAPLYSQTWSHWHSQGRGYSTQSSADPTVHSGTEPPMPPVAAARHEEAAESSPEPEGRQEVYSEADRATKRVNRFIDRMRLSATAGHGGKGCVSFWKSATKGATRYSSPLKDWLVQRVAQISALYAVICQILCCISLKFADDAYS